MNARLRLAATGLLGWLLCAPFTAHSEVTIGSKNFTENHLLAEIMAIMLERQGISVQRRFGLGGTKICFDALRNGEIDVYPEYSGTIATAIVKSGNVETLAADLEPLGLATYSPLGFNNTYVLAMRQTTATQRNITRISQLAGEQGLTLAFSHEFRARNDGWPQLSAHYGLTLPTSGIEHALAYEAIAAGRVDITDAYSTDGELSRYPVTLLEDDLSFFPRYDALWLARTDLDPAIAAVLQQLSGKIDEATMQALNARAALAGESIPSVAADFVASTFGSSPTVRSAAWPAWVDALLANTWRHIQLTLAGLLLAALVGVALALAVQPFPAAARLVLSVCGLAQTIPSIALLALMIPLFGIGIVPAVIALFVYALLPIVRATLTATNAIDPVHLTVAAALGMNNAERRQHVLVPLSMPHIIAGLRTAAVISIGTATLAAFIGAGGLGQPIWTGLALNDTQLILQGAIPAAVLAVLTDLGFDLLERRLVPAHLRRDQLN
ncbi:MAG: glycine betaine ABC transporter substrate-binding protein [Pseudomonadota bacterium]